MIGWLLKLAPLAAGVIGKIQARSWAPWALLGAILALGASHLAVYAKASRASAQRVTAAWEADKAAWTQRAAALESEYRARERALRQTAQDISDDLHAQLDETRTDYQLALDASRANAGRLRQQFQGCRALGVSGAADDPGAAGGD
ncbi:MAG: hypothetical protein LBE21_10095, partial [Pseudomonadales bacterium]|nr:hypothetical protein [Pseudomonadales bacterium]